ncbi:L-pipecolate oxidase [Marinobacterium lacunae]|uniref:L-pipecolate oxidase n=1 Tax=Marinobacterium lacunae TaxID=1232683 RepID=A0A081G2J5_9GAMM|nr:FAD-binding oxidoreductase [Marinobacterium lacunae]KEA65000.1 L-pipecolate oxidase [Marinobacterium lacunae]
MFYREPLQADLPDSLWAHSAAPAPLTPCLEGQHTSRIVVIGGGFTGLSTALHLAEEGAEVTLLEANDIGFGGSGRNVGLANAGLWTKPDDIEAVLGKPLAQRLYTALSKAPDLVYSLIERFGIQCEATRNGTLHLGHSRAGLRDLEERTRQLQQRGAPVELLSAAKTAEMTGSKAYHGAIFDPRAGTIQPLGYARGLATAALSLGARIFTRSPVTGLERASDGWVVSTPSGAIHAEKVVLATNAYSTDLWKSMDQTFTPLHFFQFATAPLDTDVLKQILPGNQGCWDTRDVMTSLRLDQSGRLILGSVGRFAGDTSSFLQNWASSHLRALFPDHYPRIVGNADGALWRYGWTGKIAYSDDHLPHLHLLAPDLITVIGYSGRGIGPGSVMGKAIADHLLGAPIEEMPLPVTDLRKMPFRHLLGEYYCRGSDLYHLYQRIFRL